MGKFDKMLLKIPRVDDKVAARAHLVDLKNTIEEGILHYLEREKLDDWWKSHYTNSIVSWRRKLEKVNESIKEIDNLVVKEKV